MTPRTNGEAAGSDGWRGTGHMDLSPKELWEFLET